VLTGQGLENRRGGFEQDLRVHVLRSGGELELLIHRGPGDPETLSDPALRHARGRHGVHCEDPAQPRDLLVAAGAELLVQQGHKVTLSKLGSWTQVTG
jgi:hypothetical protein